MKHSTKQKKEQHQINQKIHTWLTIRQQLNMMMTLLKKEHFFVDNFEIWLNIYI
jgi:GTP-binding protein EngB required for normal cell division